MKLLPLLFVFGIAGAAHAQLYKCVMPTGKVEYQQAPCSDARQRSGLSGGTTSGVDAMPQSEIRKAMRSSPESRQAGPSMSVVGGGKAGAPTEQEIKNLETSANSITKSKKEREFLQDEARRARAAKGGEGNYTSEDQRRLKEAQDSQSKLNSREREQARQDAESIHLRKGSDAVRDEVLVNRQIEADRQNARRAAAAAQASAQSKAMMQEAPRTRDQDTLHNCFNGTCYGNSGASYTPVPLSKDFTRGDGRLCTRDPSGTLTC